MSGRLEKRVKKGETLPATPTLLQLADTEEDSLVRQSKIKAEYLTPEGKRTERTAFPTMSLREHILSLSLFPNIYNQKYLMEQS